MSRRVLFFGDLAGTGFGTVTMDLGRELLALGLDVRFTSQNEFDDLPEPFASRTFRVNHPDGHLILAERGGIPALFDGSAWPDGWKPQAAIVLADFLAARIVIFGDEPTAKAFASVPTFHYIPVEGVDLPPRWAELWKIIRPVAMTNFGAGEIERITGTRPPVVYHGVHHEDFWPASAERPIYLEQEDKKTGEVKLHKLRSKEDCKRYFGASPDSRWVLRCDRHMPRKRYNSFLRAVLPVVVTRHRTYVVIHCRSWDQGGDLYDTLSKWPEGARQRVVLTGYHDRVGGAPREILNALYNAADVYASNSAEGFGLCLAEALACGTPAVGVDYSAVPEVIGPAGICVREGHLLDNEYDHAWWAADELAFGSAVGKLLDDDNLRAELGKLGPKHVRANFTWSGAARQFAELIAASVPEEVAA
jgi:glycosyltransferase involved in cell wall biosynthesis